MSTSGYKKRVYNRLSTEVGIARLLNPLVKRSLGTRGFQDASVFTKWEIIAGAQLAQFSRPVRIQYQRGSRNNGVLHIEV